MLGVLLTEPLALASALPVPPVAEPEAPMLVPLPVLPLVLEDDVSALVVGGVEPDEEVAELVEGGVVAGGVVVDEVDVDVSVVDSRWQADSDSAAIRATAAQRARGRVVIRTLLSGCR